MVVVQASKLNLPNPSLSSPHITSLLFEPTSLSLALMHSDSSFSLYPSLSPLRISSSLPPPQTTVPAPCSSSTFVLLQNPNSAEPRPLFVASGPHAGGSRILLRFYILQGKKLFHKARVVCNQKDFQFVERFGVLVDSVHGVSVKLAGSVNFFAMYSVSGSKAWIFAVKLVDDEVVKLMRCAVIECSKPVFSITLSFGVLILGEEWGVRVFNLRQLVKGRAKKVKNLQPNSKSDGRKSRLPNGVIGADVLGDLKDYVHSEGGDRCGKCVIEGSSERTCNCYLDGKSNRHLVSVKQRAVRLRQDSSEAGACFLAFSGKDVEASKSRVITSVKAISIQALSPKKFLILDSAGNLHLLCWFNRVTGSDMTPHIRQLPQVTNVQKLAVLADSSIRTQTVWLSDGHHSLHVVAASDIVAAVSENDRTENEEKLMQISVIQAIFASEKIEDVIPLASNAILILGQGSLYAYAVS
ncbi:uncharacterized protein LOC21392027 [Morus notabilis]|uniref:uncharacterized protein LOC21392027 n=1 Tax=Morus notabilis TaxID=981085 RepID=UPI000CED3C6F|nr:uncharacterized protein LOC21392027 [Morus notabilis]